MKKDGRKNNGGRRPNSGRKIKAGETKKKQIYVSIEQKQIDALGGEEKAKEVIKEIVKLKSEEK